MSPTQPPTPDSSTDPSSSAGRKPPGPDRQEPEAAEAMHVGSPIGQESREPAGDPEPVVCLLSGDLIFASRVRAAAERADWRFELAGNVGSQPRPDVAMVIVDLSTRSGIVPELMNSCRTYLPEAKVIAFGPHVQVGRLKEARQAGIPTVLTRGQFDAALGNLFGGA